MMEGEAMATGIRRNSRESEIEAVRAILLFMQDEDLRSKDRDYQIWLQRTGWR
jgi:hypothetical protein